ncbi:MAG: hypothetical protein FWE22_03155 [Firmicutes bacterium]|nr:hypothetical protein [Bacillota bacterium]
MKKIKLLIAVAVMMAMSLVMLTACPQDTRTVTWTAPDGFNITATVDGEAFTSGSAVEDGASVVFTLPEPTAGQRWRIVSGTDHNLYRASAGTWTLPNIISNRSVAFTLEPVPVAPTYLFTFNAELNGHENVTVVFNPATAVAVGTNVVITITIDDDYEACEDDFLVMLGTVDITDLIEWDEYDNNIGTVTRAMIPGGATLTIEGIVETYVPALTRTAAVNIIGTGQAGVGHNAPSTVLQTATLLVVTLTGVATDATVTATGGVWNSVANTMTFTFTAGASALNFEIVVTAPLTRTVDLTITGSGMTGVEHNAPATVLQTATELAVTLTGVNVNAIVTAVGGVWNATAQTVTFTFTAGESALVFEIVVIATHEVTIAAPPEGVTDFAVTRPGSPDPIPVQTGNRIEDGITITISFVVETGYRAYLSIGGDVTAHYAGTFNIFHEVKSNVAIFITAVRVFQVTFTYYDEIESVTVTGSFGGVSFAVNSEGFVPFETVLTVTWVAKDGYQGFLSRDGLLQEQQPHQITVNNNVTFAIRAFDAGVYGSGMDIAADMVYLGFSVFNRALTPDLFQFSATGNIFGVQITGTGTPGFQITVFINEDAVPPGFIPNANRILISREGSNRRYGIQGNAYARWFAENLIRHGRPALLLDYDQEEFAYDQRFIDQANSIIAELARHGFVEVVTVAHERVDFFDFNMSVSSNFGGIAAPVSFRFRIFGDNNWANFSLSAPATGGFATPVSTRSHGNISFGGNNPMLLNVIEAFLQGNPVDPFPPVAPFADLAQELSRQMTSNGLGAINAVTQHGFILLTNPAGFVNVFSSAFQAEMFYNARINHGGQPLGAWNSVRVGNIVVFTPTPMFMSRTLLILRDLGFSVDSDDIPKMTVIKSAYNCTAITMFTIRDVHGNVLEIDNNNEVYLASNLTVEWTALEQYNTSLSVTGTGSTHTPAVLGSDGIWRSSITLGPVTATITLNYQHAMRSVTIDDDRDGIESANVTYYDDNEIIGASVLHGTEIVITWEVGAGIEVSFVYINGIRIVEKSGTGTHSINHIVRGNISIVIAAFSTADLDLLKRAEDVAEYFGQIGINDIVFSFGNGYITVSASGLVLGEVFDAQVRVMTDDEYDYSGSNALALTLLNNNRFIPEKIDIIEHYDLLDDILKALTERGFNWTTTLGTQPATGFIVEEFADLLVIRTAPGLEMAGVPIHLIIHIYGGVMTADITRLEVSGYQIFNINNVVFAGSSELVRVLTAFMNNETLIDERAYLTEGDRNLARDVRNLMISNNWQAVGAELQIEHFDLARITANTGVTVSSSYMWMLNVNFMIFANEEMLDEYSDELNFSGSYVVKIRNILIWGDARAVGAVIGFLVELDYEYLEDEYLVTFETSSDAAGIEIFNIEIIGEANPVNGLRVAGTVIRITWETTIGWELGVLSVNGNEVEHAVVSGRVHRAYIVVIDAIVIKLDFNQIIRQVTIINEVSNNLQEFSVTFGTGVEETEGSFNVDDETELTIAWRTIMSHFAAIYLDNGIAKIRVASGLYGEYTVTVTSNLIIEIIIDNVVIPNGTFRFSEFWRSDEGGPLEIRTPDQFASWYVGDLMFATRNPSFNTWFTSQVNNPNVTWASNNNAARDFLANQARDGYMASTFVVSNGLVTFNQQHFSPAAFPANNGVVINSSGPSPAMPLLEALPHIEGEFVMFTTLRHYHYFLNPRDLFLVFNRENNTLAIYAAHVANPLNGMYRVVFELDA